MYNTAKEVKDILHPLCDNNIKLKKVIDEILKDNPDSNFLVYPEQEHILWDVEEYGDDEGTELALHHGVYFWQSTRLVPSFAKLFGSFDWDAIELSEKVILMVHVDCDDDNVIVFQTLLMDNMVDGVVDWFGIKGANVNTMYPYTPKNTRNAKAFEDSNGNVHVVSLDNYNKVWYHDVNNNDTLIKISDMSEADNINFINNIDNEVMVFIMTSMSNFIVETEMS